MPLIWHISTPYEINNHKYKYTEISYTQQQLDKIKVSHQPTISHSWWSYCSGFFYQTWIIFWQQQNIYGVISHEICKIRGVRFGSIPSTLGTGLPEHNPYESRYYFPMGELLLQGYRSTLHFLRPLAEHKSNPYKSSDTHTHTDNTKNI